MLQWLGRKAKERVSETPSASTAVSADDRPVTHEADEQAAGPSPVQSQAQWNAVIRALRAVADGHLQEAGEDVKDLPEDVQMAFQQTLQAWNRQLVSSLRATSTAIELGARPLMASDELARDTRVQNEQVNQIAAVAEELAASVTQVATNAQRASAGAHSALEQLSVGIARVGGALESTIQAGNTVEELHSHVARLGAAVEPIKQVLVLIEDIADQTNLLALNAAIEAARAGEHGRGFAVVASEVRRLAERTQGAVRDVQKQIQSLSEGAGRVEQAMDQVGKEMAEGVRLAKEGEGALREISQVIKEAVQPIREIATAADEQAKVVGESSESVQVIAGAGERVQEASQQLAVMVSDLQSALRRLRDGNSQFQLQLRDEDLLDLARADHVLWVQKLHEMLLGRETLRPEDVTDHTKCRLGQWYYHRGKEVCGTSSAFLALEEPHRKLHALARAAAQAWAAGRQQEARETVRQVVGISQEILNLLTQVSRACAGK